MEEATQSKLVTENDVLLPLPESPRAWAAGHDVEFYDSETFLYDSVSCVLVDAIRAAQPIVVIATPAHRKAFAERMRDARVDIDELVHGRDIAWLDARDTLAGFMDGNAVNSELFFQTVGSVFERITANRKYVVVRAYGEMVDLLWKDGNSEGALVLEDLWNQLAKKYSFSLLCAYGMESFSNDPQSLAQICAHHGIVRRLTA
jgi:hypothetical protein